MIYTLFYELIPTHKNIYYTYNDWIITMDKSNRRQLYANQVQNII